MIKIVITTRTVNTVKEMIKEFCNVKQHFTRFGNMIYTSKWKATI